MTLDEWVEKNAEDLDKDIQAHLTELCGDFEEAEAAHRCIMISVRQWAEGSKQENQHD